MTRDFREVRKAFPEKTPVFLRVSQATTPYFSQKTQKFYLFVKDPQVKLCIFAVAPSRGAWIEIAWYMTTEMTVATSPPSRGAWIEMDDIVDTRCKYFVAPLAGGVD